MILICTLLDKNDTQGLNFVQYINKTIRLEIMLKLSIRTQY